VALTRLLGLLGLLLERLLGLLLLRWLITWSLRAAGSLHWSLMLLLLCRGALHTLLLHAVRADKAQTGRVGDRVASPHTVREVDVARRERALQSPHCALAETETFRIHGKVAGVNGA
jgi:hypothetical protein